MKNGEPYLNICIFNSQIYIRFLTEGIKKQYKMKTKSTGKDILTPQNNPDEWYIILKSIVENALTPTLLFDNQGKIVFHSKSFEDLWDTDDKTIYHSYNIMDDQQLMEAGIMPLIQKAFKGEIPEHVEIYYDPAKNANPGRPRWIKANAYPVTVDGSVIKGVVVVMEDISKFKNNEESARKSSKMIRNFMNSVSDALAVYDDKLNYVEINKVTEEQIGRPRSEIIGKNITEILKGIEKTKRYKQYLKILKTGGTFVEEVDDHPFAPGKIILIKAFKLIEGLGITTTDITSSKKELQKEVSLNRDLEVLKDSAMDLVEINFEDELYSYTAEKLSSICDGSFVLINILDEASGKVVVKGLSGEKKYIKTVERALDNPIVGRSFPPYKNHERLKTGKLFLLKDGLAEVAGNEISRKIFRIVQKLLTFKQINTIGFIRQGKLYGNALILTYKDNVTLNTNLIEAFINQISIAIHRAATEKALLDSEKRFEIAFSTTPDSVNINRMRDGVYIEINEGFTEITGYTRKEIIGYSSLEKNIWVNPEERQKLVNELNKNGFVKNMEAEFRMKGGEIRVGLMSAHRFVKDGVDHIISITRDITDRKTTERSLKASEERYRVVAKQTGQIIYDYNIKSGQINWAGAIEEVTGYSTEEFANVQLSIWESMVHPDEIDYVNKLLQNSISLSGPFNAEYRFRKKDGTYIYIEDRGMCIKGESGTLRMLGSMADITEQKKYQDSLRIAWKKAEESDKLKTAFLANLSHEIRTPMNAILGFSDLLMNGRTNESKRAEYISIINKSSHNLLNIINDIIDFSMIETGQLQIYNNKCSVNEIIKDLYNTFRQYKIIEGKDHLQILMKQPLNEGEDSIISDEERIKQIMSNLISNSIKYTEKGRIEFGCTFINIDPQNPVLEFNVIDTGIGIDPEHHQLIFERFRQLEESNTRRFSGNGLGLSISKQIANLMGGDIHLRSEKGKGSTFYFTIPYRQADVSISTSQIELNEPEYFWSNKRIIVAEDVSSNFQLIKSMLQETDINIDWARDGNEVLDLLSHGRQYDLILMDIRMPGMNGYEAASHIRKTNADLPIIALSANARQSDLEKSLSIGCNDHISKPVSLETLLHSMARLLS